MTLHHIQQKKIANLDLLQVMDAIRHLTYQAQISVTGEMQIRSFLLFTRLVKVAPSPELKNLAQEHLKKLNELLELGLHSDVAPPPVDSA